MPREIARRLIGGIWRTVDADEASSGGGGSGASSGRWIDLGTVSVEDVLNGPTTIYTPGAGEYVVDIRLLDGFTYLNDGNDIFLGIFSGTRFGPAVCLGNANDDQKDLIAQGLSGFGVRAAGVPIGDSGSLIVLTLPDPLILALTAHDTGSKAAVVWTALTAKEGSTGRTENVFGDGHLWYTENDGDTGASEPDWTANFGGSVVDGDLTWFDSGALPTAGEAHVLICVATPEAV